MLSTLVGAFSFLMYLFQVLAAPQSTTSNPLSKVPNHGPAGQKITLSKRSFSPKTEEEWGIWAKAHRENLENKYSRRHPSKKINPSKRGAGENLLTNQNADSSYFGSLEIGSPPTPYNVILDTGSADLWVAGATCETGCESVASFNATSSATFSNQTTPFSITYGSGQASGTLGSDVIQMAGFSVSNQVFAVCNQVSSGLLSTPVSGLLGLAFQTIASSKAMPFWQTLVSSGAWDSPVMAFHLTRYINDSMIQTEEPGGSFTMGFTNSSLYTGDIDFVNMPTSRGSYWILGINSITVNDNILSLPSGPSSYAAIDTGTTLVGGPSDYISRIFAQIPGSQPGKGNFQNYYTYPCDTAVNVSINFGGKKNWTVSPGDFQLSRLNRNTCLGAFFELSSGSSAPNWIVGDTFLKNVYSVFRYDPLSVGFAELSHLAQAENGVNGPTPTATLAASLAAPMVQAPTSTSGAQAAGPISRSRGVSTGSTPTITGNPLSHHATNMVSRARVAAPMLVLSCMSLLTGLLV